ncbi:hypothetical protein ACK3TF_003731 [Chlorella vulgaris]
MQPTMQPTVQARATLVDLVPELLFRVANQLQDQPDRLSLAQTCKKVYAAAQADPGEFWHREKKQQGTRNAFVDEEIVVDLVHGIRRCSMKWKHLEMCLKEIPAKRMGIYLNALAKSLPRLERLSLYLDGTIPEMSTWVHAFGGLKHLDLFLHHFDYADEYEGCIELPPGMEVFTLHNACGAIEWAPRRVLCPLPPSTLLGYLTLDQRDVPAILSSLSTVRRLGWRDMRRGRDNVQMSFSGLTALTSLTVDEWESQSPFHPAVSCLPTSLRKLCIEDHPDRLDDDFTGVASLMAAGDMDFSRLPALCSLRLISRELQPFPSAYVDFFTHLTSLELSVSREDHRLDGSRLPRLLELALQVNSPRTLAVSLAPLPPNLTSLRLYRATDQPDVSRLLNLHVPTDVDLRSSPLRALHMHGVHMSLSTDALRHVMSLSHMLDNVVLTVTV